MSEALEQRLRMLKARSEAHKQKHRADVAYVQKNYPKLTAFLTDMTQAFGRINYRVTLRGKK